MWRKGFLVSGGKRSRSQRWRAHGVLCRRARLHLGHCLCEPASHTCSFPWAHSPPAAQARVQLPLRLGSSGTCRAVFRGPGFKAALPCLPPPPLYDPSTTTATFLPGPPGIFARIANDPTPLRVQGRCHGVARWHRVATNGVDERMQRNLLFCLQNGRIG